MSKSLSISGESVSKFPVKELSTISCMSMKIVACVGKYTMFSDTEMLRPNIAKFVYHFVNKQRSGFTECMALLYRA